MDHPTTAVVARFIDKVWITKSCWLWIGYKNQGGYGQFWFHGKIIKAHRFSYELFVGPIEPGKLVLHRRECNNRSCVNPHHLYMGTVSDNARDKYAWGGPDDSCHPYGEDHCRTKLSEEDVLEIRRFHEIEGFSAQEIADEFGVSKGAIYDIAHRRTWRHLE